MDLEKVGSLWSFYNKRDIFSSLGSGRKERRREGSGERGENCFWKVVQHRDETSSFVSNETSLGSYLTKAKFLKISGPQFSEPLNWMIKLVM